MSSGAALTSRRKSLRADHLDDVPRRDVFFGADHVVQKHFLGHVGGKGDVRHVVHHVHRQVFGRLFEQRNQTVDLAHRLLVGFLRVGASIQNRADQDGDGLGHAVENQKLVRDQEIHHRRLQVVPGRARHDRFDVMYKFVADETDRPAGKARQTGQRHGLETPHDLFHHLQPVADGFGAIARRGRPGR